MEEDIEEGLGGELDAAPGHASAMEAEGLLYVVRPAPEMTIKAPTTRNAFRRRLKANVGDAVKRWGLRARVRALYGLSLIHI